MERSPKNLIWEIFRGVAALMVLFHHYTKRYDALFGHIEVWPIQSSFNLGSWGVCVFFVLTGLFLIPSLVSSDNLGVYYKKRIVRLYPSYIPCVLITWLTMSLAPTLGDRNVGIVPFLANLTMFQRFFGLPNVDGAYWTLAVQLVVYIIMGALFFIVRKDVGKMLNVLFVWFIICIGVTFIERYYGFTKLTFITDAKYIQLFIQGILVYCIGNKQGKSIRLYVFLFLSLCYDLLWFSLEYFIFNLLLIILMLLVQYKNIKMQKKEFFVFIGSISFPLYLLHQNIGYIIIRFMENHGLTNEVWIVIPVIITIGLAWAIASFVEKPFSKMLKQKLIK